MSKFNGAEVARTASIIISLMQQLFSRNYFIKHICDRIFDHIVVPETIRIFEFSMALLIAATNFKKKFLSFTCNFRY